MPTNTTTILVHKDTDTWNFYVINLKWIGMAKKIIYLIILSLFVNAYKKFIFPFSFVNGTANVYLTPKFYLVDPLLILLLFGALVSTFSNLLGTSKRSPIGLSNLIILALIICFFFSSLFSTNFNISIYYLIRLVLYLSLFFWIRPILNRAEDAQHLAIVLSVPVLIISLFAIFQWRYQHSVWGFFPLGEPLFSSVYANSPLVNFLGSVWLRSFGTFPHPNILGGFLAISLIWILDSFIAGFHKDQHSPVCLFQFLAFLLGLFALFISFSQSAWAAFILGLVLYLQIKMSVGGGVNRLKLSWLAFGLIFLILSFFYIYKLPLDSANTRRIDLTQVAFSLWGSHPLVGIGAGNFVSASSYFWKEPVHNIYFLILSETGIVGFLPFLLLLLYSLIHSYKKIKTFPLPLVLIIEIMFLGLFDHYLITSSAGSLLFWIILGMANA
jgi:O-antigen ligase